MNWRAAAVTAGFISADQLIKILLPSPPGIPQSKLWPILTLLAACVAIYIAKNRLAIKYGLLLIMAGGLSNLFDLFLLGYIRDVLHIHRLNANLADAYIILGCLLILIAVAMPHRIRPLAIH